MLLSESVELIRPQEYRFGPCKPRLQGDPAALNANPSASALTPALHRFAKNLVCLMAYWSIGAPSLQLVCHTLTISRMQPQSSTTPTA